jgi:hypothetical protein
MHDDDYAASGYSYNSIIPHTDPVRNVGIQKTAARWLWKSRRISWMKNGHTVRQCISSTSVGIYKQYIVSPKHWTVIGIGHQYIRKHDYRTSRYWKSLKDLAAVDNP